VYGSDCGHEWFLDVLKNPKDVCHFHP